MLRTKETSRHEPHPARYLLCLLVSVLLLLSLLACTTVGGTGDTNAPETTAGEEPQETVGGTEDGALREDLAYYVALVGRLQEEIAELKAENFILSSLLKEPTDTEAAVTLPFTYEKDDDEVTVLSYVGTDSSVTVPAEIEGLPVTKIGERAFAGTQVESVTLPDSVEEIDWFAFANCSRLKSLTAGASVDEIGYGAFDGCPAALTVITPKGSFLEKYAKSYGIAVRYP